jgi:hypothetical protein
LLLTRADSLFVNVLFSINNHTVFYLCILTACFT